MKTLPKHQKPREQIQQNGVEFVKNVDLLSAILGTGHKSVSVKKLAGKLLQTLESKDYSVSYEDLRKITGLGDAKSCLMLAVLELGRRIHAKSHMITISKTEDVISLVQKYAYKRQEHLIGLYLNARGELLKKKVITIGTASFSPIHPREVFYDAIRLSASCVILVHNHPSGSLEASQDDIRATAMMREAGEVLGIEVIDHIIISKEGWARIE